MWSVPMSRVKQWHRYVKFRVTPSSPIITRSSIAQCLVQHFYDKYMRYSPIETDANPLEPIFISKKTHCVITGFALFRESFLLGNNVFPTDFEQFSNIVTHFHEYKQSVERIADFLWNTAVLMVNYDIPNRLWRRWHILTQRTGCLDRAFENITVYVYDRIYVCVWNCALCHAHTHM